MPAAASTSHRPTGLSAAAFADLRESLDVSSLDFPPHVLADAERSIAHPRAGHGRDGDPLRDDRPARVDGPRPGAAPQARRRRLSRALRDRRRGRLRSAGRTDGRRSARTRPDPLRTRRERAPLPPQLSEGAASLLRTRAASARLDDGRRRWWRGRRSRRPPRARAQPQKLDYARVQRALDDRSASESLLLLREVGLLRQEREARRGGINLAIPEQEVERGPDGWTLSFRALLPVEGWNAQVSLLAGQAAAMLMLDARIGVLRTLPAADPSGQRGCAGRRGRSASSGTRASPSRTSSASSTRRSRPTPPCSRSRRSSSAARATRHSRARCLRRAGTRASARSTHTRRLLYAGSSTATWARSASPSAPAQPCPTGCARPCPRSGDDGAVEPARSSTKPA